MKGLRYFKERAYFRRILFLSLIPTLILLILLSFLAFNHVKSKFLERELSQSQKVLKQITLNWRIMDESIGALAKMLYFHEGTVFVMNFVESGEYDFYHLLKTIDTIGIRNMVVTNPFIDSIYAYNHLTDTYYQLSGNLLSKSDNIGNYLQRFSTVPILQPLLRQREDSYGNQRLVFSYVMYESVNAAGNMEGAVIVNVSSSWILESLQAFAEGERGNDTIILASLDGHLLSSGNRDEDFADMVVGAVAEQAEREPLSDNESEHQIVMIDGSDYLISTIPLSQSRLILMKVTPYKELLSVANDVLWFFLLTTTLVFVGGVFLIWFFSWRVYKPLGMLVAEMRSKLNSGSIEPPVDEIRFLKRTMETSVERAKSYEMESHTHSKILRKFYLRRLLLEDGYIQTPEATESIREYGLGKLLEPPLVICIMKLVNVRRLHGRQNKGELRKLQEQLLSDAEHIFSSHFQFEGIAMENGAVLCVFKAKEMAVEEIHKLLKADASRVIESSDMVISVSLSNIVLERKAIPEAYQTALANSSYAYVRGGGGVITPERVQTNNSNDALSYSGSLNRKLESAVRGGDPAGAESVVREIVSEIATLRQENISAAMVRLIDSIRTYGLRTTAYDTLFGAESIQDFQDQLINSLRSHMVDKTGGSHGGKHSFLVSAVQEIIAKQYMDPGLSVDSIAPGMKLSPRYVNRVFKAHTGVSVQKHINDTRLICAAELLRESNANVYDIAMNVGFSNVTYFYKLFKREYGLTPKDYAAHIGAESILSDSDDASSTAEIG